MRQTPADRTNRPETALQRFVEFIASALILVEIVVLLVGVVSRFVFHRPLVRVDEFASICFLWLAMTGATVATICLT